MLYRYQNKQVRVTTVDGVVFTGIAEVLPSGYGLHEFDREEESIQLDDVILFKSEIRTPFLCPVSPRELDARPDDRSGSHHRRRHAGRVEKTRLGKISRCRQWKSSKSAAACPAA